LIVGETTIAELVIVPGIHVYVAAPITASVVELPLHIVELIGANTNAGVGETAIGMVLVDTQAPLTVVKV
jgi:hypothetical protein